MFALWKAVSSTDKAFCLRGVILCRCDLTPTTDLIMVTCPLLLIGEIQQSFSVRWPLYHTASVKLNLPVITPFFVDAVGGRIDFVGLTAWLLLLGFLCIQLPWMTLQ